MQTPRRTLRTHGSDPVVPNIEPADEEGDYVMWGGGEADTTGTGSAGAKNPSEALGNSEDSEDGSLSTPTPTPMMRSKGKGRVVSKPASVTKGPRNVKLRSAAPNTPAATNTALRGPGVPGNAADEDKPSSFFVPSTPSPTVENSRGRKRARADSPDEAQTTPEAVTIQQAGMTEKRRDALDKGEGSVTRSKEYQERVRPYVPTGAPDLICTRGGHVFRKELFDDLVLLTASAILEARNPNALPHVPCEQIEASIKAAVEQRSNVSVGRGPDGTIPPPPPYVTRTGTLASDLEGGPLELATPAVVEATAGTPSWYKATAPGGGSAQPDAYNTRAARSAMKRSLNQGVERMTGPKTVTFAPSDAVFRFEVEPMGERRTPEGVRDHHHHPLPTHEGAGFAGDDTYGGMNEDIGIPRAAIPFTTAPQGGFPQRWPSGPDDLMRGIPQVELDIFLAADRETRIVLQVAGQPLLDEHIAGYLVGKMRDVIAALTGQTQGIIVYAPLPADWMGEDADFPTAFLVRGLKPEAKAILVTQSVWPTELVTILVDEYEGRTPSKYVLTMRGFSDGADRSIALAVRMQLQATERLNKLAEILRSSAKSELRAMIGGRDTAGTHDAVDYRVAAKDLIENFEIRVVKDMILTVGRRVVAEVYAAPPTTDADKWIEWRMALNDMRVNDDSQRGVTVEVARCNHCKAANHPTEWCPLLRIPGWLGPYPLAIPFPADGMDSRVDQFAFKPLRGEKRPEPGTSKMPDPTIEAAEAREEVLEVEGVDAREATETGKVKW
ncbi:hypothetical protein C8Q78DRAFT_1079806 [Trametes maxima]|nr:hypothetical protein C8Q78DRAFT_1079806 [Trametes maxima]